jgi:hypothetical protein
MRSANFPTRLDGTYLYKNCLHLSNKETTTAIEVATDGLGNRECKPRPSYDVSLLDDHLEARGLLYSVHQMMTSSIPKHPPTPKKTVHAVTEGR